MKLLKENQTAEYQGLAWELGDVGVSLTCAAEVSYVDFNTFVISGPLSYNIQMSYSFRCLVL